MADLETQLVSLRSMAMAWGFLELDLHPVAVAAAAVAADSRAEGLAVTAMLERLARGLGTDTVGEGVEVKLAVRHLPERPVEMV